MKAMILAAGLGTRLKPFTDKHPKALAEVCGKTLLEINIQNLQRFGIYDVVVNVHHFASQIEEYLTKNKGFGSRVVISDERDEVLETGGGLKNASHLLHDSSDILILNVDILSNFDLAKMLEQHSSTNALATLAVQERTSSRYFLFENKNDANYLKGWENRGTQEQKLPCGPIERSTALAFSGISIIKSELLTKITQTGKFSLVDVFLSLCCSNSIAAWNHTGDKLLDVGKPESLAQAETMFAVGQLMKAAIMKK